MKETQNPIAQRSMDWIAAALIDLMKEKPFSSISITEISNRADLNRRTFYRSFTSKEEVLTYYLDKIWHEALNDLKTYDDHSYFQTVMWYLDSWYNHKELALLLYKNNLIPLLMKEYDKLLKEIYLLRKGNYPLAKNPEALDYALSYSAGGLLNILCQWCREDMKKTPEEVAALLRMAFKMP